MHRNHVQDTGGDGPCLLYAHGYGCTQAMWRHLTPAFAGKHRQVLFDFVGCGQSDPDAYLPDRYRTLAGYAQDVSEIIDALDLRDVTLVGHSVSGVITLLAALERLDRVAGLIMVAPSPRYLNDAPHYTGGFEEEDVRGLLGMIDRNEDGWTGSLSLAVTRQAPDGLLHQEFEASVCAMDPTIARRFAEATFFADNRADLHRWPKPALILQCEDDVVAPMGVGQFMRQQMPAAQLEVLPVTGHCPHMSHPELTIAAMQRFLAGMA